MTTHLLSVDLPLRIRWGRGQETPGEDPYVNSEYGVHYVTGVQQGYEHALTGPYLLASACLKHFAAYSLEQWDHGVSRFNFNAIVSDADLADTYLVAFKATIQRARASGLMCSCESSILV